MCVTPAGGASRSRYALQEVAALRWIGGPTAVKRYDALIVGAGPAGLSAAVYLARFLRATVVIDAGDGRMSGPQLNENYLGFPGGVRASRFLDLGRKQAQRFGACFVQGSVAHADCDDEGFVLRGDCGEWHSRAVILATGVTDIWPAFPNVHRYVGRSLFWCITCDGFRSRGKRTLLIGANDEAATTALQFLMYTRRLTYVATGVGDTPSTSLQKLDLMRENGIDVVEGRVERVEGRGGLAKRVVVGDRAYEVDLIFSLLGHVPNSRLAAQLGAILDEGGYVAIDRNQCTNVPRVYAAGDVTGPYAHQVTSAVHEGAMAAQTVNYELYADFQRD